LNGASPADFAKEKVSTMTDQENGESQSGTPQAFLNSVVGQPVWVRLNSGIDYKGDRSSWID
jgi:hypothetical protein